MSERPFLIGTRDSKLARCQTDLAIKRISSSFPNFKYEIVAIKTSGDKILNAPLSELGGRGVFVKELEESLLANSVDLVVHSLKDLPTDLPDGLRLGAVIDREDPRDVLVTRGGARFDSLEPGSRVATSSRRRAAQLSAMRTDLNFVDIRGNIQTRMRKLDEGQCDAMVLAAAGLHRLGLDESIAQYFEVTEITPAVGQGAMGIECRENDGRVRQILDAINDSDVWACIQAERAFLHKLGGGCSVPVGAFAKMISTDVFEIQACVAALDGRKVYKGTARGERSDAHRVGSELADKLIAEGAGEIIGSLLKSSVGLVSPP